MSSEYFVTEVANSQRVPHELKLRLVTGEASRAISHIRFGDTKAFTEGRRRALQRAAVVLRDASSTNTTRGKAVPMNLVSAAISAFNAPALQSSKETLSELADCLDKVAQGSSSPKELETVDAKLELLRDALVRSTAENLQTEVTRLR